MKLRGLAPLTALVALLFASSATIVGTGSKCSRCLAVREEQWWLGIPVGTLKQSAESRAIERIIGPHEHVWCASNRSQSFTGFGCGIPHPIWRMDADALLRFYNTAPPTRIAAYERLIDSSSRPQQEQAVALVYEYESR